MKKLLALLAIGASLTMVGCASKGNLAKQDECRIPTGEVAPDWVCNAQSDNGIVALGTASQNVAKNISLQRSQAMSVGRNEIARQLQVKVQGAVKDWAQTTGVNEDQTYDKVFEEVSRQVTNLELNGSKAESTWWDSEGTMYILVVASPDSNKMATSVMTSFQNNQALWQKVQAQKAQEELDGYLEKMLN